MKRIGAALALGLWLTSVACAATGAEGAAPPELASAPHPCGHRADDAAGTPLADPAPGRDRSCELHCASFGQAVGAAAPCPVPPALALPAASVREVAPPARRLAPFRAAREPPRALRLRLHSLLL